jgi:hypothetical protein
MSKKINNEPHLAALAVLGIRTVNTDDVIVEVEPPKQDEDIDNLSQWFYEICCSQRLMVNDVAIVIVNEFESNIGHGRLYNSFPAISLILEADDDLILVVLDWCTLSSWFSLSKRDVSLMNHSRDAFRALIKSSVIDCLNELAGK